MRNSERAIRNPVPRRSFLQVGSAGLLGLGLADVLRLEAAAGSASTAKTGRTATGVIMVWLGGGPATIDMWDMKPQAPEEVRGEFTPIDTSVPGVQVCEHLPRLAGIIDKCTLVRSLHHSIPAHGPGTQYMMTGNGPAPALEHPSLGSLAAHVLPPAEGMPPYVTFGRRAGDGAGFLGSACGPFEVAGEASRKARPIPGVSLPEGFTVETLEDRARLRERFEREFRALDRSGIAPSLARFQQQALDILRSDRINRAFDLEQEPPPVRDRYGRTPLARNALAARRLIEAGVRFVTVGLGGWDTHSGNFAALRNRLLPQLDQTLSALVDDLDSRGLLETTIVYCAGEFGRTPRINRGAGRDHWARSMAVLLAGGGLKRGHVYGATDREGTAPASDPCAPDDISATIFRCLGVRSDHEITTRTGRPSAAFREGRAIEALLNG